MKIQFHDPEEFLDEIERDLCQVRNHRLRVTRLIRNHPEGLPVTHVSVVATCVVDGFIVRLDAATGSAVRNHDEAVMDRTIALMARIEKRAHGLGLEIRPGIFQD